MSRPTTPDLSVPTRPESLQMLEQVLAASRDVISLVALDGTCLYASPASQVLLGYAPDELVGLDAFAHVHPEDAHIADAALARLVQTGQPVTAQFRMVRRGGDLVWVEASAQPPAATGLPFGVVIRDITERKELEELLTLAALHDPVTGLPNRRLLDTDLAAAVARSERSLTPLAVLFIDLDDFKVLNDRWGHLAGDEVLRSVARRLEASVRAGDLAARYGGDEFVVVMFDVLDPAEIAVLGQRIRDSIALPHTIGQQSLQTSASIGAAVWHEGRTAEDLLQDADAAMYLDKQRVRHAADVDPA